MWNKKLIVHNICCALWEVLYYIMGELWISADATRDAPKSLSHMPVPSLSLWWAQGIYRQKRREIPFYDNLPLCPADGTFSRSLLDLSISVSPGWTNIKDTMWPSRLSSLRLLIHIIPGKSSSLGGEAPKVASRCLQYNAHMYTVQTLYYDQEIFILFLHLHVVRASGRKKQHRLSLYGISPFSLHISHQLDAIHVKWELEQWRLPASFEFVTTISIKSRGKKIALMQLPPTWRTISMEISINPSASYNSLLHQQDTLALVTCTILPRSHV